jgi:hypothetical protein
MVLLRPSTLLAEIRQQNVILMRALNGIRFETDEKAVDPVKSRAGHASWAVRSARGDLRGCTAPCPRLMSEPRPAR